MRRVLILGSPGSGKSTLARQLGVATGVPVVHLDQLYWRAGWVESTREEWLMQLNMALAEPTWIMDGNYGGTVALRLQHADAVVFLDYPTRVCLWRALRRIASGWGRDRPDLTPGCPERVDLKFLLYVVRFRGAKRPGTLRGLEGFPGAVYRVTAAAEGTKVVASITSSLTSALAAGVLPDGPPARSAVTS